MTPFTIRLTDRYLENSVVHDHVVGIDPGSKTTGLAVARETTTVDKTTGEISTVRHPVMLMELTHRGSRISARLRQRAAYRRGRRSRNLRYRAPRFDNRTKPTGWLPPSLQHRVDSTAHWADRLRKLIPVSAIAYKAVRFDTQKILNPEITGAEYQQGTLSGYEVREYLLEKFNRTCVYCDAQNTPLNIDHVHPRARGGSDRVDNLVIACIPCNQAKGAQPLESFVIDPRRLERIKRRMKTPLRDAAAVSATRRALHLRLTEAGLPITGSSGGRTKFNRTRLGVPKTHCLDALCVGDIDEVGTWPVSALQVTATGRGVHQRTTPDSHGFPRLQRPRTKLQNGFATGDLVRACVPSGKKVGTYLGRVAVRSSGWFNIITVDGTVQGIRHSLITPIQRGDGYSYSKLQLPEWKEVAGTMSSAHRSLMVEPATTRHTV